MKTEVEIEFTPIEDDDDEVIDVQSDEDGKATIDPTSSRDKNLVIGAKHDEAKKPVHEEPSMDLDLVLEQLKVLSEHRKRVKENKEQAHKVQIQQQQQVTARREEEEKIKQKMTRENKLRTEGTLIQLTRVMSIVVDTCQLCFYSPNIVYQVHFMLVVK